MVELPDVTLVIIDSVAHALARRAVFDTINQIKPHKLLIASDRPDDIASNWPVCDIVKDYSQALDSIGAVEQFMWYDGFPEFETSHILFIQYDGWVLDGSLWRPEWLKYDYIGAPWMWHEGYRVGNGGFSLRSRRLMQFLADHRDEFPVRTPEDDTLCRSYRPFLEAHGFRWAPTPVAMSFSFERERPRRTFGFHGIFNWPHVLSPEALAERKALANDYVRSKVEWKELPT